MVSTNGRTKNNKLINGIFNKQVTKKGRNIVKVSYINLEAQANVIKEELMTAIQKVVLSGMYVLGEQVRLFEKSFSEICNTKYAIGVSNGTDALILAMKSLGIGIGDEVITVPNSFLASTSSIALTGAKPVFVDVSYDYNMDPSKIKNAITDKTKAILPVHLTGRPANMKIIMEIAQEFGLYIVEDCAQAVGAEYAGKKVGSSGDLGCFSLHPLKNLNACGDGGVITTNNKDIYEWLLMARNHGLKGRDQCEFWAYNNRLDEVQAAVCNVKLKYINEWSNRRRQIAGIYREGLDGYVISPNDSIYENNEEIESKSVYHTFIIQANKRNELHKFLLDMGVDTKIHYAIPVHLQKAAESLGYVKGSFPVVEDLCNKILSLPIYPELSDDQVNYVINSIRKFYDEN